GGGTTPRAPPGPARTRPEPVSCRIEHRPALLGRPDQKVERDATIDMAAGETVPSRPEAAYNPEPYQRCAGRVGPERQGQPAQLRFGCSWRCYLDRRVEAERDDVAATIAAGDPGGNNSAIRDPDPGRRRLHEHPVP